VRELGDMPSAKPSTVHAPCAADVAAGCRVATYIPPVYADVDRRRIQVQLQRFATDLVDALIQCTERWMRALTGDADRDRRIRRQSAARDREDRTRGTFDRGT
jgi:hypothetical protein